MELKIKVVKDTVGEYKAIKIQANQDNVPVRALLEALYNFKDQCYLKEAFAQKNVQAFAKIGHYYHPLGAIPIKMYEAYMIIKQTKVKA